MRDTMRMSSTYQEPASLPVYEDDAMPIVSNHSGYDYEGSENFEHDGNGAIMNFSGVYDDVYNSFREHEGWTEGYDY